MEKVILNQKTKICTKCNTPKPLKSFYKSSTKRLGVTSRCKKCANELEVIRNRTPIGVIKVMYKSQRSCSRSRGHELPEYTLEELSKWLYNNGFKTLYDNWVNSGFNRWLKPSVDRLENSVGYKFSNIQLLTWRENHKLGVESHTLTTCRPVIQLSLSGVELNRFKSVSEASVKTGCDVSDIIKVCKKVRKTSKNFKWKYDE